MHYFKKFPTNNLNYLSILLIYPILEELTFRGFIQELLYKKYNKYFFYKKISVANVVTSLLFAMMHMVNHSIYWAVLVFFPSLVFGYFKDKTKIIMPSILLHIIYNSIFFGLNIII